MSERTGDGAGRDRRSVTSAAGASTAGGSAPCPEILRLTPHVTPAEAVAVLERRLPGAVAEATAAAHPFWWVELDVEVRGLLHRGESSSVNVLVDAVTGKASIADVAPQGVAVDHSEWPGPPRPEAAVGESARALVRTKAVRTFRLGMSVRLSDAGPVRGVLKPNWLVRGANRQHSAVILVDGLDASHYVVRVERS